ISYSYQGTKRYDVLVLLHRIAERLFTVCQCRPQKPVRLVARAVRSISVVQGAGGVARADAGGGGLFLREKTPRENRHPGKDSLFRPLRSVRHPEPLCPEVHRIFSRLSQDAFL